MPAKAATYYVSSSTGDDSNTGLLLAKPRKTLSGLTSAIRNGNTILLKRGDIFFESLTNCTNCSIGAYGTGNLPVLCGFMVQKSSSSWVQDGSGIWKIDLSDASAFYGHAVNGSSNPTYLYGNVGCLYNPATDVITGQLVSSKDLLANEGDFFTSSEYILKNVTSETYRYLYIKSSSRPGTYCFSCGDTGVYDMSGCTIENLAIVGFGNHGVTSCSNCTIRNCAIDIIGGSILKQSSQSSWVRYGNGVQCYLSPTPYNGNTVTGCQITRVYDTATTIQGTCKDGNQPKDNNFIGNRIAFCRQAFEQWTKTSGNPEKVIFTNCSFKGNYCYCCGDNKFTGTPVHDQDCTFLSYNNPASELPVENNLVYGTNYRYAQQIVGGFNGNEVYLVKSSSYYILNFHWTVGNQQVIKSTSDVQTAYYRKYSKDTSTITLVEAGSEEDTAAREKVWAKIAYQRVAPTMSEIEAYK